MSYNDNLQDNNQELQEILTAVNELPSGGGITPDLSNYVQFTDIATTSKAGVVKINNAFGIRIDGKGALIVDTSNDNEIAEQRAVNSPLKPDQIPKVVKSGLVKHDNVTLTDEEKARACDWIGALPNSIPSQKNYGDGMLLGFTTTGQLVYKDVFGVYISAYSVPYRDGDGVLHANAPKTDTGLVNKKYAEDNFVAKMVGTPDSGATRGFVYALDSDGTTPKLFPIQIQATANTIALRNPSGNFYVTTPTLVYECANKGYVDDAIAEFKTEEFTFKLKDGTTVTKKIVVK